MGKTSASGRLDPRAAACVAAKAAWDKQGSSPVVMEMRDLLGVTDYFVVVSGSSERHVRAIVEEVEQRLASVGFHPARREGERYARWVLLDYLDFVVHIFHDDERAYYDLERLWRDAPRVDWEDRAGEEPQGT